MKANSLIAVVIALFMSVGVYAQNQPDRPKTKSHRSMEERVVKRTEKKLNLKDMTRSERKVFKKTYREQRQARLNAMTPEKRARVIERRQQHR